MLMLEFPLRSVPTISFGWMKLGIKRKSGNLKWSKITIIKHTHKKLYRSNDIKGINGNLKNREFGKLENTRCLRSSGTHKNSWKLKKRNNWSLKLETLGILEVIRIYTGVWTYLKASYYFCLMLKLRMNYFWLIHFHLDKVFCVLYQFASVCVFVF